MTVYMIQCSAMTLCQIDIIIIIIIIKYNKFRAYIFVFNFFFVFNRKLINFIILRVIPNNHQLMIKKISKRLNLSHRQHDILRDSD